MENKEQLIAQCEAVAKQWLAPSFDEETRKEVQAMLDNEDKTALIDAFYRNLEFGTGGLRGIMGAGTNRMNKYIVGMATQGFANYVLKAFAGRKDIAAVITDANLPRPLPLFSLLTASRYIYLRVSALLQKYLSQYAISKRSVA